MEKISSINFDLKLEGPIEEVKTWTVLEYLALGSIEIPTNCLNLVRDSVEMTQISAKSPGLPYESPGLFIEDNTLTLDQSVPAFHSVSIILKNEEISLHVSSQFSVIICGFESIVPRDGASTIVIELSDEDTSKEFFEDKELSDLLKSSAAFCKVDESSFKLVKNLQSGQLDRKTGQKYVMLDLDRQQLYVDRKTAISSSFSAFLVATTKGGVYGGFYEFRFKISRKENAPPEFDKENESLLIKVDQREQAETGLEKLTYESTKVTDPEGHSIFISVDGVESIKGAQLTIN